MEPVLQRFGDVTIQRVERPKPAPPPPPIPEGNILDKTKEGKDEESSSSQEEDSTDENEMESPISIKRTLERNFPDAELTAKKFKLNPSDISLDKKFGDDILNSFSDDDISDFETESEVESEEELVMPEKPLPKETSEDESMSTSFLEKLVETPFIDPPSTLPSRLPETATADSEDYDYDIKEKLKEMGEISFETVKKGEKPKKIEVKIENEVVVTPAKKPGTSEEDMADRKTSISGLASVNMRRNIREVMDETKLDEATLAAQRLEMERLQRVQEQQKLLRELQRQAAQERMQNKVISLLQGNNFSRPGPSSTRIGNTVLVKLPNGLTKPMTRLPKRPFDLVRVQKGAGSMPAPKSPRSVLSMKKPSSHLTPSVSIAPVTTKKHMIPMRKPHSDSESEGEEIELPMPKRKSKDAPSTTTTIDISSDDDCIVVSEPEGEGGSDDHEEDPSNSGMHTNDEFNQPDSQGRVVINIGHPDNESDIFLAPQIARIIKPHQIGGVRFLYDNVIESINRFESSAGFGCILAHSMGLGKTLQIVCFSDIFLRHTPAKTILCIMPINTLQNWMAEFNMWLPTEEGASGNPLQTHGEIRSRHFNLHVLNDSHKTLNARAKVIHAWRSGGGVLLIGYEQFRLLSLKKHPKSRRKTNLMEPPDDHKNKALFDEVHEALVKPGPDLVICDEGHRIKNSHASISQALKQMKTKRRIVLTGYPLQNNLMEYWCMVDFARPNYLGSKTEFCNMFERPIMNGQCIDSTEADIKLMRYRAHVLHSLLVGFVQRRSHTVLHTALPQKEEYVLLVRMTHFQRTLYETFMNEVVRIQAVPNPLKAFAVCCKIWNHPDVLYNFLKKRAGGDARDIDLDEVAGVAGAPNEVIPKSAKTRKTPARAKKTRGKNGKPAASVTPYNSSIEQSINATAQSSNVPLPSLISTANAFNVPSQQHDNKSITPVNYSQNSNNAVPPDTNFQSTFFEQANSQFPQNYPNKPPADFSQTYPDSCQTPTSTNFTDSVNTSCNFDISPSSNQISSDSSNFLENLTDPNLPDQTTKSYLDISTPQSASKAIEIFAGNQFNPNFNEADTNSQTYSFNQQQSYQNFPQNFWGQNDNYNPNDFFSTQSFNSNYSNSNSNSSWIKKEDKSIVTNNVNSPVKSESSNDSKPKINIISDIKLPSMFTSSPSPMVDRKINIISDIKIEPKKEEIDDKLEIKRELGLIKDEFKREDESKPLFESPTNNNMFLNFRDKEDCGIPYDWAIDLLKEYVPGCIANSAKMEILFCIIRESINLGDRLLVFSQSLITLDLIEQFLQNSVVPGDTQNWCRNTSYYRLDGSTSALEREKLINEFNSNPKIHLFLVSTRAGSLGINLIGANRVVVLDASWNPCHDTQAVCRVYRYGQRKPCFVYRLVVDNCLEKKIYDRQINKQGMSDRVVDECNPDAHLTMKDVSTLCWDNKYDEGEEKDWAHVKGNYIDVVLQKVLNRYGRRLNCEPFQHESLLVDRKEKQLSQQEKRLAKKSYEREKQASRQPAYNAGNLPRGHRPVASVRPMQQGNERPSRWIPAEHWQRQGMTAQEMTLPLDVVIPTNQPEKGNIVLKAGQKVLVLKSPKGVYMQLESGKIVAIKTAIKVKGKAEDNHDPTKMAKPILPPTIKVNPSLSVLPQKKVVKPFTPGLAKMNVRSVRQAVPNLVSHIQQVAKKAQTAKSRPYNIGSEIAKSLSQKDEMFPTSSDDEHVPDRVVARKIDPKMPSSHDSLEDFKAMKKRISLLKTQISIKRTGQHLGGKDQERKQSSSVLDKLEETTSLVLHDNIPFQDTLDSITSAYKDDNIEDETSTASSGDPKNSQAASDTSDHSDEVTYVSEQPPQYPPPTNPPVDQVKTEAPSTDYPYNYYNYQPYPPPPQGYGYPPAQPPPYDMMGAYPQQPQPPYNYGYQGYPPPQPHYPPPPPQPGYDYNAPPPPQPLYPGYHNPYTPQQYPPPPPQNMYPPPPPAPSNAPPYPDYQYQQVNNPAPVSNPPPTTNAPPPLHSTPPNAPYYPNS